MSKILVVDDEKEIVRLLQHTLKLKNYDVSSAITGRDALEHIAFDTPDLVILDVMMPVMDGFATLKAIRENPATAQLPVVMLTAKTDADAVAKGWHEGATLYLAKPFAVEDLLACIEAVLKGKDERLPPPPGQRNL
jgi:DNA-binding response OmpR family regulator